MGFYPADLGNVVELTTLNKKGTKSCLLSKVESANNPGVFELSNHLPLSISEVVGAYAQHRYEGEDCKYSCQKSPP